MNETVILINVEDHLLQREGFLQQESMGEMGYLFGMKVMRSAVVVVWAKYRHHNFKKN